MTKPENRTDPGPTFDVYPGTDGVTVVHIDTDALPEDERGPVLRVYVNDGAVPIYDNPGRGEGGPA